MRLVLPLLFVLLAASAFAQPYSEAQIQADIDAAIKAGGGEVVIPPGTHRITRGLVIKDAKQLRLVGLDGEACVLQLPPLAVAVTTGAVAAGSLSLPVKQQQNLSPGMRLHIEADGAPDAFTKKAKPYQLAFVKALKPDAIELREPLAYPVPAGTLVRDADAPNLIEVRGKCEGVRIEKLTLDGGKLPSDVPVRGHVQLCGVLAQGAYDYAKGPTAPRLKGIHIERCIIQHCHGRGIAFYSVEDCRVSACTIMDCNDEAVDLDHFTLKTEVRDNHIARCLVAVELNDASDCLVTGNEARDCGIGIHLWRWCQQPGLNERNIIRRNTFQAMRGNGLQLGQGTAANVVEDNLITDSGRNGISLQGENHVLKDNHITGSKLQAIHTAKPEAK